MQSGSGMSRGLNFDTDHNKSKQKRSWNPAHLVSTAIPKKQKDWNSAFFSGRKSASNSFELKIPGSLQSAPERHKRYSTRCTNVYVYQKALRSNLFETVMRLIWWKMELMLGLFNTCWGRTMYGPLSDTHM